MMVRILFVTNRLPFPPVSGDRQRTFHIHRALQSYGEVDTILLGDPEWLAGEENQRHKDEFRIVACYRPLARGERGLWRAARPLAPARIDRLAHNLGRRGLDYDADPAIRPAISNTIETGRYNVIVSRYLVSAAKSDALAYGPNVLDLDDLETQVLRSRIETPGQPWWVRAIVRWHIRQLEKAIPSRLSLCSHVWLCASQDRAHVGAAPSSVLPNVPFLFPSVLKGPVPVAPDSKTIAFVGSLTHRPNADAVEWFVNDVWPEVRRVEPAASFHITGSGMTGRMRDSWAAVPGVDAIGFVDDPGERYGACAFTIAPFFEGGGTKIKILESLRYGRTCVATAHAHRGYEDILRHDDSLWIARNRDEMTAGCLTLLRHPELRARLAKTGLELVERYFSFGVFEREVHRTLETVATEQPVRRRNSGRPHG